MSKTKTKASETVASAADPVVEAPAAPPSDAVSVTSQSPASKPIDGLVNLRDFPARVGEFSFLVKRIQAAGPAGKAVVKGSVVDATGQKPSFFLGLPDSKDPDILPAIQVFKTKTNPANGHVTTVSALMKLRGGDIEGARAYVRWLAAQLCQSHAGGDLWDGKGPPTTVEDALTRVECPFIRLDKTAGDPTEVDAVWVNINATAPINPTTNKVMASLVTIPYLLASKHVKAVVNTPACPDMVDLFWKSIQTAMYMGVVVQLGDIAPVKTEVRTEGAPAAAADGKHGVKRQYAGATGVFLPAECLPRPDGQAGRRVTDVTTQGVEVRYVPYGDKYLAVPSNKGAEPYVVAALPEGGYVVPSIASVTQDLAANRIKHVKNPDNNDYSTQYEDGRRVWLMVGAWEDPSGDNAFGMAASAMGEDEKDLSKKQKAKMSRIAGTLSRITDPANHAIYKAFADELEKLTMTTDRRARTASVPYKQHEYQKSEPGATGDGLYWGFSEKLKREPEDLDQPLTDIQKSQLTAVWKVARPDEPWSCTRAAWTDIQSGVEHVTIGVLSPMRPQNQYSTVVYSEFVFVMERKTAVSRLANACGATAIDDEDMAGILAAAAQNQEATSADAPVDSGFVANAFCSTSDVVGRGGDAPALSVSADLFNAEDDDGGSAVKRPKTE